MFRCTDADDAQITGQYYFSHLTSYANEHRENSAIIANEYYCHQSTTESGHKQINGLIWNRFTIWLNQAFGKGPHYWSNFIKSWFLSHTISVLQTGQLNVNREEYYKKVTLVLRRVDTFFGCHWLPHVKLPLWARMQPLNLYLCNPQTRKNAPPPPRLPATSPTSLLTEMFVVSLAVRKYPISFEFLCEFLQTFSQT